MKTKKQTPIQILKNKVVIQRKKLEDTLTTEQRLLWYDYELATISLKIAEVGSCLKT